MHLIIDDYNFPSYLSQAILENEYSNSADLLNPSINLSMSDDQLVSAVSSALISTIAERLIIFKGGHGALQYSLHKKFLAFPKPSTGRRILDLF